MCDRKEFCFIFGGVKQVDNCGGKILGGNLIRVVRIGQKQLNRLNMSGGYRPSFCIRYHLEDLPGGYPPTARN